MNRRANRRNHQQAANPAANPDSPDITLEITLENNLFWLIAAVAFCMPIYPRVRAFIENRPALANVAGWLKTPANLLMLATNTALLVGSSYNPFLYYRF